ncbi:MAG TPA: T9SS type A sorting domain-containing protein [Bacteroidales bacterium]
MSADYNYNGKVKIQVYNNFGQQVKTLIDIKTTGGKSFIRWTGNDNNKSILPPGIYYVVMYFNDSEVETLKVVKR